MKNSAIESGSSRPFPEPGLQEKSSNMSLLQGNLSTRINWKLVELIHPRNKMLQKSQDLYCNLNANSTIWSAWITTKMIEIRLVLRKLHKSSKACNHPFGRNSELGRNEICPNQGHFAVCFPWLLPSISGSLEDSDRGLDTRFPGPQGINGGQLHRFRQSTTGSNLAHARRKLNGPQDKSADQSWKVGKSFFGGVERGFFTQQLTYAKNPFHLHWQDKPDFVHDCSYGIFHRWKQILPAESLLKKIVCIGGVAVSFCTWLQKNAMTWQLQSCTTNKQLCGKTTRY